MSDTPRTDSVIDDITSPKPIRTCDAIVLIARLSQSLERELNAAKARAEKAEAENAAWKDNYASANARAAILDAERDALRKALESVMECPTVTDVASCPNGDASRIDEAPPYQAVISICCSWTRYKLLKAALHGTAKKEQCACTVDGVVVRDGCEVCSPQPVHDVSLYDSDSAIYKDAIQVLKETRRVSTSVLQRRLNIGYNSASKILLSLERDGIVGKESGCEPRQILVDLDNLTHEPKPRTCGECAKYVPQRNSLLGTCGHCCALPATQEACPDFKPRADAQKGQA